MEKKQGIYREGSQDLCAVIVKSKQSINFVAWSVTPTTALLCLACLQSHAIKWFLWKEVL